MHGNKHYRAWHGRRLPGERGFGFVPPSPQRLRGSEVMRGKRTRNYGVPVACATTPKSLSLQGDADFAASQRCHLVLKFVGRERGDRSILIARELIRERTGFKTKADDSIRIVDAVGAEVRDRTG